MRDEDGCADRGGRALWTTIPIRADLTGGGATARLQWNARGELAATSLPVLREAARLIVMDARVVQELVIHVDAAQSEAVMASVRTALELALTQVGAPALPFRIAQAEVSPASRRGSVLLRRVAPVTP